METDQKLTISVKRLRQADHYEKTPVFKHLKTIADCYEKKPVFKRLKTIYEKHSAEIPTTSAPYSLSNFTSTFLQDIWRNINPHLPPHKIWECRLVSHAWKCAADTSITSLNFRPINRTTGKLRTKLEHTHRHTDTELQNCPAYYWKGGDDQEWERYKYREIDFSELQAPPVYEGTLFLWQVPSCPSTVCETSDESPWKRDEVIISNFKTVIDLAKFPNLQALNLSKSTAITDADLIKASNLSILNLKGNTIITNYSVTCLLNLTMLDIRDAAGVKINALHPLRNLMIVKFNQCQEMGDFFQLPNIQELYFLAKWGSSTDPYAKQQMMYIAEALFSLIDKNAVLANHPDFLAIKNKYEKHILLPNANDLGAIRRKTTYPFNSRNILCTQEEEDYLNQLTRKSVELWSATSKNDDSLAYLENPWEKDIEIYEIIADILRIIGMNLKIFVDKDNVITSLEKIIQNEKRE